MHGTADRARRWSLPANSPRRSPGLFYPFEGRCHLCNMTATEEFCDVLRQFVLTGQSRRRPVHQRQCNPLNEDVEVERPVMNS